MRKSVGTFPVLPAALAAEPSLAAVSKGTYVGKTKGEIVKV